MRNAKCFNNNRFDNNTFRHNTIARNITIMFNFYVESQGKILSVITTYYRYFNENLIITL